MENLRDYIRVYKDILDDEFSKTLLSKLDVEEFANVKLEGTNFDQRSLTEDNTFSIKYQDEDVDVLEAFSSLIYNASVVYFEDVKVPLLPELQGFEGIKIRKFKEGAFHKLHLDVNDHKSAKRFLTVLLFLGEGTANITFPILNATIQLSNNSVLVMPPTWMFPYEMTSSSKETIYVATSHLHYI